MQVQSGANVAPYWIGGPQGCVPGAVQSIKVIGSAFKDTIDLTQVPRIFVWNAALEAGGKIDVDCTASGQNQFVGDTIKLGGLHQSAEGSPYADTIKCGPDGSTVDGGGGADTITGGAGADQLTLGGAGKGPGFNQRYARIDGGGGNDVINGGNMQSKLYGDGGNDKITAGPWGDFIDGGDGSDTLRGGAGVDTIHGGGGDDDIDGMGAPAGKRDQNFTESGNNYVKDSGAPVFDDGNRANDYGKAEGNHTNVGGIRFTDANNNGANDDGNAWVDAGDTFGVLATRLSIPVPDPAVGRQPRETIVSVSYYLDDHGWLDQDGNAVVTQGADNSLEQWCDEPLGTEVPGLALSVSTKSWEPGTYKIFAIALASNGYEGCPWWRNITVAAPKVMINAPVPQTQEMLAGAPGVFDVTRDGPTDSPLTVNYTLSGTATNGTDYSSLSGAVTIPAGSADATIDVNPLDDGDGDDGAASQTCIATLTSTSGDYAIDPDASSATVNIMEETPPTVTISATQPNAVEADTNNQGEYVVTRTGPTDESLTVNLAASGTAAPGTNYDALPASVTIPAGSQTAVLLVNALEDSPGGNDPETVTETIQPGSGYTVGTPDSADVNILEKPTSTVTIAATTPNTTEDGTAPGEFTVTRTAPYGSDLTVAYSLSGTAVNGVGYQSLSGSITIPANAPSVVFDVNPLDDGDDTQAQSSTVIATLDADANQAYRVGNPDSATVNIAEEPPPAVSIVGETPQISENGSAGTITVQRNGPRDEPLTVYFSLSGDALPGTDFTDPGTSVTIPVGDDQATVAIAPLDDGDGDDTLASESLTLTLSPSPLYQIINGASATMTINEEPIPQVTVARQSDAVENPASNGSFLLSRTGPTDGPLTVTIQLAGSAIEGTDYQTIGSTITIPAGQSSTPITISPIDDQEDEPSEEVWISIVNQPGSYAAVSPSSAQLTIEEDGAPTVNVVAGTPTISETGGGGYFTVSRTGSLAQPLTVYYETNADDPGDFQPLAGDVTIPAGFATAGIDVTPVDDGDADDTLTSSQMGVTLVNAGYGSYNIGTQSSATITIDEDQPPTVQIAPYMFTPPAVEGGPTAYVWIARSAPYDNALTVAYNVSGSAEPGVDYDGLPGEVTIPVDSEFGVIPITALEDDSQWDAPGEYVTVTLIDENIGAYQLGGDTSKTVDIDEKPTSTVAIMADSDATEGGADGRFIMSRSAPYDQPLTVSYTVGGSALAGTDYEALSGTVTIPAGSNSAAIDVAALPDSVGEDDGDTTTVEVQISAPADYSYRVAPTSSATVNINEEPPPVVSIAAEADDANEDGTPGQFTVQRSGPTDAPLTVGYTLRADRKITSLKSTTPALERFHG